MEKIIKDTLNPYQFVFLKLLISEERAARIEEEFSVFEYTDEIFEINTEGFLIEISPTDFYLLSRKQHLTKLLSMMNELSIPHQVRSAIDDIWNMDDVSLFSKHDSYTVLLELFENTYSIDSILDRMLDKKTLNDIHIDLLNQKNKK